MKNLGIFIVLASVAFILQAGVLAWSGLQWGRPDLLLVLVVFWSWQRGWKEGVPVGFTVGLVNDMLFSPLLGLSALSLSLVGYVAGELRERVYEQNILLLLMTMGLSSLVGEFSLSLVSYLFRISSPVLGKLICFVLLTALYNCGLAFVVSVVRGLLRSRAPQSPITLGT